MPTSTFPGGSESSTRPQTPPGGERFPVDPDAVNPAGPSAGARADVWKSLRASLAELQENVGYLLAAKVDSVKLLVRRAVLLALMGIVGLIALATVVIVSVVLVLHALANGLNFAMNSIWLGDLIVGAAILIFLMLGLWLGIRWVTRASARATRIRYESRKSQQRARYGRDVEGHSDVI